MERSKPGEELPLDQISPLDNEQPSSTTAVEAPKQPSPPAAPNNPSGTWDEAAEGVKHDPELGLAKAVRATDYLTEPEPGLAATEYDRALADYLPIGHPMDAYAFYKRGSAFEDKGDYDGAIAEYNQMVVLDPHDPEAFWIRGRAYEAKGDYDHAIADYTQMIELNPKRGELPDWFAFSARGSAYEANDDFDRAIRDFDEAIRLDPVGAVFIERGIAYAGKGQYDRAIADFSEAVSLDPENTEPLATFGKAIALGNRGKAYIMKGEFVRAIRDFDEAIRLDPKGADFIAARDRAIADEAIRLNPLFKEAIKSFSELDP